MRDDSHLINLFSSYKKHNLGKTDPSFDYIFSCHVLPSSNNTILFAAVMWRLLRDENVSCQILNLGTVKKNPKLRDKLLILYAR